MDLNGEQGNKIHVELKELAQDFNEHFQRQTNGAHLDKTRLLRTMRVLTVSYNSEDLESKGATAYVQPVSLQWDDLTYTISTKKTEKVILNGCQGSLSPGRMLAILGPSGSGKTSLLNALAGRTPYGGELRGSILLNGEPRDEAFRLLSAYVIQDDALFHNLSVRETMLIAAELRLPTKFSKTQKQEIAERVIFELGLAKAADTYIGNSLVRGVSGGEKKRVNIGIEMMGNPSIIFLDEPTSGLDSFQAQNVIQSLKDLANNGRTVLTTVHQPRSSIYRMFDYILLLSEGRCIFFGEAYKAVQYFDDIGFTCPEHFNPADYFLDLISIDTRSKEMESGTLKRVKLLAQNFNESAHRLCEMQVAQKSLPKLDRDISSYRAGSLYQFLILFKRALMQTSRDKITLIVGIVQSTVFAIIVGSLYTEMERTQKGIQDRIGALFFVVVNNAFGQMFATLNIFTVEKLIVQRERAARAYNVLPYYLAKILAETPFRLIGPTVFSCISYWMIGFNPKADRFATFYGIVLLVALAAQALGILIGSAAKNQNVAMTLAPFFTVILLLFGGFYVNKETVPLGARWVEYFSHIQWAFTALCINEFKGQTGWSCDSKCAAYEENPSNTGEEESFVCVQEEQVTGCSLTGEDVLKRLSMDDQEVWEPMLSQAVLIASFHILACLALVYLRPKFQPLSTSSQKGKDENKSKKQVAGHVHQK